ncbi:LacI family DNA-binding transcriptional regulator [Bombiscardovia coagulans]|uniref:Transcriptional regulator, LacI family n=1 Tax=Bombiscardovia coagulans TaxID=686666 RepID=A0A261ESU9_9BIFI|nr:LacI family DNA-binding transcriptional regulator [Bombiscardovia coagulans]OZG49931.1 transcriptional regulator, LacI family [Bombiscardovia coagulans]
MGRQATITDVARAAGVSTFTVSKALRNQPHVAPATRQRVLEAASKLNYAASKSAAALVSGKTKRVALLIGEQITGWFNGCIQEGIYDVLSTRGYDLLIYRAGSSKERQSFFEHLPAKRNADAIIVVSFTLTDAETQALQALDMPIIAIHSDTTDFSQGSVRIDDRQAEIEAVHYLSTLGHKRFSFLDRYNPLPEYSWGANQRINGYKEAIKRFNLVDCGVLSMDNSGEHPAKKAAAAILSMPKRPTAICAWSDNCALSLISELRQSGILIPEQLSVMGFDSSDVAELGGLSSVSQPARAIGANAAKKALDLINGVSLADAHTLIKTQIIPRDSTGPAPVVP